LTNVQPRFAFKELDELLEIHNALKFVSQKVGQRLKNDWDADREAQKKKGKKIDINDVFPMEITTSQVALNYVIAKGAVPLFNAVSAQDAQEFAKAKEWKLKGDELELLEEAAAKCEKR
jgi:aryl-alcohol dehydrogenase-like predicted oxidoreductase